MNLSENSSGTPQKLIEGFVQELHEYLCLRFLQKFFKILLHQLLYVFFSGRRNLSNMFSLEILADILRYSLGIILDTHPAIAPLDFRNYFKNVPMSKNPFKK